MTSLTDQMAEALRPFADAISAREDEAHRAIQFGGYIPCEDEFKDDEFGLTCANLRAARSVLALYDSQPRGDEARDLAELRRLYAEASEKTIGGFKWRYRAKDDQDQEVVDSEGNTVAVFFDENDARLYGAMHNFVRNLLNAKER